MNPNPETTLAVILGASEFPKTDLTESPSFRNSARALEEYLLSDGGFDLPKDNLLNLFDSSAAAPDIDEQVGQFLKRRSDELAKLGKRALDLLVYYVGHGSFAPGNSEYFLAIQGTRRDNELGSSYSIRTLARTLREYASQMRRYLILDSCFSAAAYKEFESAPLVAASQQILDEMPPLQGTALLSASGPREPAKAPQGEEFTMFSGCLLDVLRSGAESEKSKLSIEQVAELTRSRIKKKYTDNAVRPQILSPDQSQGEVAKIPLFPNPARREEALRHSITRLESQMAELLESKDVDSKRVSVLNDCVSDLESRMRKLEAVRLDADPTLTRQSQNSSSYRRYGFTDDEWATVPGSVKAEVIRFNEIRLITRIWAALTIILCGFAWVSVTPLSESSAYLSIPATYACWTVTFVMAFSSVMRRWIARSEKAASSSEDYVEKEQWHNYEVVARARNYLTTEIVSGFEIGRTTFSITSVAYLVTTIATLAAKTGYLKPFVAIIATG